MTDRAIRPIKIIDRDRCIGCKGYARSKNRWRAWDHCYENYHIPDISVDCPFYSETYYERTEGVYTHDFTGYDYAVTSKMAKIIADGVNTRHFSAWGESLYSPGLWSISSRGEMKGWSIYTHPYGQQNRICCNLFISGTSGMRIWDINTARIREDNQGNNLFLKSVDRKSYVSIPIVDAPLEARTDPTESQKSIFDYVEV